MYCNDPFHINVGVSDKMQRSYVIQEDKYREQEELGRSYSKEFRCKTRLDILVIPEETMNLIKEKAKSKEG
jgi:hypothetical protein